MTSQQRKLVYLVAIIVLLIPIFLLGLPSTDANDAGGQLAQLRQKYELGESTLGEVDPSSATMNFVLLGLRGVAANLLWMEHDEQKTTKNWAQMRSTTDSIIALQPHFKKVWRFHSWDLAYNVSSEWDGVPDRFYWVKEGAKFAIRGVDRNRKMPELPYDTGNLMGNKIGRSDEWRLFRKYFKNDPDSERFGDGPDTDLNPDSLDNYLVGRQWYLKANEVDEDYPQQVMLSVIFRQYPVRMLFDYGDALQREGIFNEETRGAWADAFREWTGNLGQELFDAPEGTVKLEVSQEDVKQMAEQQKISVDAITRAVSRYQNVINYHHWRTRGRIEALPETVAAHREIYEGQQLFKEAMLGQSREKLLSGMQKFETLLTTYPELEIEDDMVEEGLMAVLYFQFLHEMMDEPLPAAYPLMTLYQRHQQRVPELIPRFRSDNLIAN